MKVVLGESAKIELANAFEWYEVQQKGLGKKIAQALDITKKRISLFPEVNSEISNGIRRALIRGFPYGLIYSVQEDVIEIIAVAHLHREPMYWGGRIWIFLGISSRIHIPVFQRRQI